MLGLLLLPFLSSISLLIGLQLVEFLFASLSYYFYQRETEMRINNPLKNIIVHLSLATLFVYIFSSFLTLPCECCSGAFSRLKVFFRVILEVIGILKPNPAHYQELPNLYQFLIKVNKDLLLKITVLMNLFTHFGYAYYKYYILEEDACCSKTHIHSAHSHEPTSSSLEYKKLVALECFTKAILFIISFMLTRIGLSFTLQNCFSLFTFLLVTMISVVSLDLLMYQFNLIQVHCSSLNYQTEKEEPFLQKLKQFILLKHTRAFYKKYYVDGYTSSRFIFAGLNYLKALSFFYLCIKLPTFEYFFTCFLYLVNIEQLFELTGSIYRYLKPKIKSNKTKVEILEAIFRQSKYIFTYEYLDILIDSFGHLIEHTCFLYYLHYVVKLIGSALTEEVFLIVNISYYVAYFMVYFYIESELVPNWLFFLIVKLVDFVILMKTKIKTYFEKDPLKEEIIYGETEMIDTSTPIEPGYFESDEAKDKANTNSPSALDENKDFEFLNEDESAI